MFCGDPVFFRNEQDIVTLENFNDYNEVVILVQSTQHSPRMHFIFVHESRRFTYPFFAVQFLKGTCFLRLI